MKETDWASRIAEELNKEFPGFSVEAGKKLIYANEIVEYRPGDIRSNEMEYQTDILVYEITGEKSWKPRVVIETKIGQVTTHDAITYSQKSSAHKYVHPYIRYGIFLGNMGNSPLPGRLFRHGAHFDFMISWKGYEPEEYERDALLDIINREIDASKQLEEMLFNTRSKQRQRYFVLHKPLITRKVK